MDGLDQSEPSHILAAPELLHTHKECVFKAVDCPIFITVAAAFGKATDALLVCNPLDGINIPSPDEVVKQFEELLGKLTDAGSRYESSLRRLIGQAASALGFPKVDALLPSIADARAAFDLSTFATLAGPHNEGFDCHVNSLLKVDAAGNFHAFSMSVSDRVTDERTASWLTLVSLTIRLAPPAKVISATPANNQILAVRLISRVLVRGKGDCEDYAIAKFVALQEAGISADDLRIVILRDDLREEDHAVVAARLDGHWLMLDNRHMVLVEDHDVRRYRPLFLVDRDGVKAYSDAPSTFEASRGDERAIGQIRR
jgi:Bacterial transglutaminase-like cysteine proteinase BTLCP